MTRSKYSERRCNHCNKVTKMEAVIGTQANQEKAWFRCTRCRHMSLLLVTPEGEIAGKSADSNNATPYTPDRSFRVGESIFHTEWNDFGKVLSKTRTSDGGQAIVVNFEKQGQRTLIESLTPIIE